jgi:hypothetical protein
MSITILFTLERRVLVDCDLNNPNYKKYELEIYDLGFAKDCNLLNNFLENEFFGDNYSVGYLNKHHINKLISCCHHDKTKQSFYDYNKWWRPLLKNFVLALNKIEEDYLWQINVVKL